MNNKEAADEIEKQLGLGITQVRRSFPRGLGWNGNYIVYAPGKQPVYVKKVMGRWQMGRLMELYF